MKVNPYLGTKHYELLSFTTIYTLDIYRMTVASCTGKPVANCTATSPRFWRGRFRNQDS